MNRNLNRFAAFFLALSLTLSLCAAWAEETDENPVLVTVDGQEITLSAVKDSLNQLIEAGYASDESDLSLAMEYMIQDIVLKGKISELGLDQFAEDEEEALRAEAHAEWESAIDSYVSYFLTEDTDEARAQAREDGAAYFTAMALFCLRQGDLLWTLFALSFALLFTATEVLGVLSALLQERCPRFYRFMWTEK